MNDIYQSPAEYVGFERYPKGSASLDALRVDSVSNDDLKTIVTICNQPLVRKWLIDARVGSQHTYTPLDAKDFISFAEKGWREKAYFVYVIRDDQRKIVGAIDIKPKDRDGAEVGYWADTEGGEGGYMTNALIALCRLAREASYQRLYTRVAGDNERSKGVLRRAGFTQYEHEPIDPASPKIGYTYFQKGLI